MLASSSEDELTKAAAVLCFSVSGADSVSFLGIMEGDFEAYDRVEAITEPLRSPLYPGSQLTVQLADNPFNAWSNKALIQEAGSGKLAGRIVAIKDIPVLSVCRCSMDQQFWRTMYRKLTLPW